MAFRADMDAVCGSDNKAGHYCGHDGHCAILAGLAQQLSKQTLPGDVYLLFHLRISITKSIIYYRKRGLLQ